ncbi:MAG: Gfo/Idh/MocA family oxidoreductase [Phycisphaerae bacterium]|nr:Gfo/Idh/MocA family oxidoreductase [Phycisphaerae bacterium]NIP53462.1 Gfo/Idh/MocA family oxidoreductase [Phycisphaerae bacterium]NIS52423.1 Gfo/Idh/MocA family oxidoreductase [Phycisphaerae bacterium]NIU12252.1 Gfo/Idh/MocA family oxidoreductase [Phycisphaerae bacterium]NIU60207.1 Gfo/Idh/MocA family oxidoreductase [Phycisphaerae bacterium]
MLKIGIVGLGFMGQMHYRCWKAREDAQIAAICDTNKNLVEDCKKTVGNIEGTEPIDFTGINIYSDFGKMLAEEKLDAISLTLPTYLHAKHTIQALESGINVLCEKPMGLNVAECDSMIAAANSSGKVLQIGHCVRFWPEYAKVREIIAGGEYGKVIAATFQRLSAVPTWSYENWIMNEERSGGVVMDLHIHDSDFVQYVFGMPRAVYSAGGKDSEGRLGHVVSQYLYNNDTVITAEGGWALMPAFGFEMSFNIVQEKATIVYDCTREPAFRVCPAEGEAFTPEVQQGDGYILQIEHFVKVIGGEQVAEVTTLDSSRDSIKIVEAEKESIRTGGIVSIE